MKHLRSFSKIHQRIEHLFRESYFVGFVGASVFERLSKEVFDLVSVQDPHPLAPQGGAGTLKYKTTINLYKHLLYLYAIFIRCL